MIRTLAPSGAPIRFGDLVDCVSRVRGTPEADIARQLEEMLGLQHAHFFATGRGAMVALLRAIALENSDPERRYVVVPSFTCYSVAASVLKAGLTPLVCDIDPETLGYDRQQFGSIELNRVLSVICTSLYGIPANLEEISTQARAAGCYLIDDAAQALGAKVDDRPVGSFGDAGILSFDKGKVVTSINGGVVVTANDNLAHRLASEYSSIPAPSASIRAGELLKLLIYASMLRPSLYWIPFNLPFLKLGQTVYDESFPVLRYFSGLAPIVSRQLARLDRANRRRVAQAQTYDSLLPTANILERVRILPNTSPIYLRYPLRIRDPDTRQRFLDQFRRNGVSVSYPLALPDVADLRNRIQVQNSTCDNGRLIASELVTLPTHEYVEQRDIDAICRGLEKLVGDLSDGHTVQS